MASIMTTYVKVINLTENVFQNLKDLFETETETSSYVDMVKHVNKVYGTDFKSPDNLMSYDWMIENIGSKSINIEFGDVDYSPEVDLIIETSYNVPTVYLQRLSNLLCGLDKEIALYGTYEDESYSPIGAFVYGHDYDDIEDLYDDLDFEKMFDDDEYRESIMDELYEHRDSLFESYLEIKSEREEDNS
jgi:hypothetical protein